MKKKLRIDAISVLLILGIIGCSDNVKTQETALDIVGIYALLHNPLTTLEIKAEEDIFTVLLSGGVVKEEGLSAPADCYIKAIGELKGERLLARFAPVETETFIYSETDAKREDRRLEMVFKKDKAEVIFADTFGYCGLNVSFLGIYQHRKD